MKDQEARHVINLLQQRIEQLEVELHLLQNPHPADCKCKWCEGWTPDYMAISFDRVACHGRYMWFKEGTVEHP